MLKHKAPMGLAFVAALSLALAGCGGSGRSASSPSPSVRTASLQYTVEWPDRNRAMPMAANSAVVTVSAGDQTLGTKIFNRPQTSDSASTDGFLFEGLPAGDVTVTVTAYPELDGAGAEIAKGSEVATLKKGEKGDGHASLASTAATLEIDRSTLSMEVGGLKGLRLVAKDAKGFLVPLRTGLSEEKVVWSSSDEAVATVVGFSEGAKVTGVGAGTAEIAASFRVNDAGTTIKASVPVTVTASVLGVAVDGAQLVTAGSAIELTAIATMSDHTTKTVTSGATWSSSDSNVATVDATGKVTGVGAGNATISAIYGGREGTYPVSVQAARTLQSITLAPNGDSLYPNSSKQLSAIANYSDGTTKDVTNDAQWESSNTHVFEVSPTGLLSTVSQPGVSTISVTYGGVTTSAPFYRNF